MLQSSIVIFSFCLCEYLPNLSLILLLIVFKRTIYHDYSLLGPGDIWSGFEGGIIKVWPWEAVQKSLSLSSDETHIASLLVERSLVNLRSQVTVNGACSISSSDVKCLLSDHVRAKVWASGSLSFSLWYVFSR